MKRWILLGVLVVVISATITLAVQWLPASQSDQTIPGPAPAKGPTGRATVEPDDLVHEFGVMPQHDEGVREWTIKNTGAGELRVRVGNSTCSCTIANIAEGTDKVLQPGEQTEIRLAWNTKDNNGKFRQSADILTNDPQQPKISFVIEGDVRPAVVTLPIGGFGTEGIFFSNATNEESHTQSLAVYSYDRPELKVFSVRTSDPERFDVEVKPLDEEKRKSLDLRQGGHEVAITLKPVPVLGGFQAELTIETDHPLRKQVKVPIGGKIIGPINATPTSLRRTAMAREGAAWQVMLFVRNQPETVFEVETAPEGLRIEVQPTEQVNKAADGTVKVRAYRMTVTIPPGSPPGQIRGDIVLKTDHPQAREVKLPVNFTVVGAG
jgi:hypothetical protein